jgi:WD repeat-containing protein 40A
MHDVTTMPLLAVGSQTHVTLVDSRQCVPVSTWAHTGILSSFPSIDEKMGVRSLVWQDHVVTIGGGYGRLSFYDTRKNGYLNLLPDDDTDPPTHHHNMSYSSPTSISNYASHLHLNNNSASSPLMNGILSPRPEPKYFHRTSMGYLDKDRTYHEHFRGVSVRNAIYTLCYDTDGGRLFAGGGPLQLGLKGNYAAIWQ